MKLRFLLVSALCAALLSVGVLAAPEEGALETDGRFAGVIGHSGVVDAETGYAEGASRDAGTRVSLADGIEYDRVLGRFVFPLDGGAELRASVTDGMIVNAPATLAADGDAQLALYRNGEPCELPETGEITDAGDYVLNCAGAEGEYRVLSFTVVGDRTGSILSYPMPDGFYVREATLNEEEIPYDRYSVDLSEEGSYHIVCRCPDADLETTLDVVIDRTPPNLLLEGRVGADNRVRSAVTFSGMEAGDSIYIERNGEPYRVSVSGGSGVLKETGAYTLIAADEAGNTATYQFTILLYLDTNALGFIALALLALSGVAGYIIWKRRHLRVR